jgi:hypothetical protein
MVALHYGLGMHTHDIRDPLNLAYALKYKIIAPAFSVVSTTTAKISVVLFLLRLMGQTASRPKKYFLYGLTVISIILNVLALWIIVGLCNPPSKLWFPETPGKCFKIHVQLYIGELQAGKYHFHSKRKACARSLT